MRTIASLMMLALVCNACNTEVTTRSNNGQPAMVGTWKLLRGTLIENGKSTVTDYTGSTSFIKIINDSHFAFLQHGKDSTSPFVAGGGTYELKDSTYTEHLEYCNDRKWEGNDFSFHVSMHGDTLVQRGIEKVATANVNRENIEEYVRLKKK